MTYEQLREIVEKPTFKNKILADTVQNIAKIKKLEDNGLTEQEAITVLLDEKKQNEQAFLI